MMSREERDEYESLNSEGQRAWREVNQHKVVARDIAAAIVIGLIIGLLIA